MTSQSWKRRVINVRSSRLFQAVLVSSGFYLKKIQHHIRVGCNYSLMHLNGVRRSASDTALLNGKNVAQWHVFAPIVLILAFEQDY